MILTLDKCAIDLNIGRVLRPDAETHLTELERGVLQTLWDHRGTAVSREQLMKEVWGRTDTGTRAVDVLVRGLRQKVEEQPSHPRWIRTVHGEGYLLAGADPAQVVAESSPAPPLLIPGGVIDLEQGVVRKGGTTVSLTDREAVLLRVLAASHDPFVPKVEVVRAIWGDAAKGSRALDQVIRRLRQKVEDDPNRPRVVVSKRGEGVGLARHDEPKGRRSETFVGRKREITEVGRALLASRLVTIHGPGGIGKTQLAYAVADEVAATLTGGVVCTSFEGVVDQPGFLSRLGLAFELSGAGELEDQVVEAIAARDPGLLILDNLEEAAGVVRPFLQRILTETKGRLLVTSRVLLQLQAEHIVALTGLDLRDATSFALGCIDRMGQPPPDEDQLAELLQKTACSPLAIEIAAAQLRYMPMSELLVALERPLEMESPSLPERHRSLAAVLEVSWDLLSENNRAALCRLTVFRVGFGRDAAEAVVGSVACLPGLLDAGWLNRRGTRWSMLEPVRQFAGAFRVGNDAARAHATHYQGMLPDDVVEADQLFENGSWVLSLQEEQANLAVAFGFLMDQGEFEGAARTALLLGRLSLLCGGRGVALVRLEQVRPLVTEPTLAGRLDILRAWIARWFEPHGGAQAEAMIEEALGNGPSPAIRRRLVLQRSMVWMRRGAVEQACEELGALAAAGAREGDPVELVAKLSLSRNHPDATQWLPLANEVRRRFQGGDLGRAHVLFSYGNTCWLVGQLQRGKWAHAEALGIAEPFPHWWAFSACNVGFLRLQLGDLHAGERLLRRALSVLDVDRQNRMWGTTRWRLTVAEWQLAGLTPRVRAQFEDGLFDPAWGTQTMNAWYYALGLIMAGEAQTAREVVDMGLSKVPDGRPERTGRLVVIGALALALQSDGDAGAWCKRGQQTRLLILNAMEAAMTDAVLGWCLALLQDPKAGSYRNRAQQAAEKMMLGEEALLFRILESAPEDQQA